MTLHPDTMCNILKFHDKSVHRMCFISGECWGFLMVTNDWNTVLIVNNQLKQTIKRISTSWCTEISNMIRSAQIGQCYWKLAVFRPKNHWLCNQVIWLVILPRWISKIVIAVCALVTVISQITDLMNLCEMGMNSMNDESVNQNTHYGSAIILLNSTILA